MGEKINPALSAFLDALPVEGQLGEVTIRREGGGFELKHAADSRSEAVQAISLPELREVALFNAAGQFRPLKAAPDLRRGWRLVCRDEQELWRALQELYPGALPDWHAVQTGTAVATDYREFTNRQTGMYRITQLHADEQAARVVGACCPPHLCLKRRYWTVGKLAPDAAEAKSSIPCLEPCAVFLELARKSARIEQEERLPATMPESDWRTAIEAVQALARDGRAEARMGDIGSPLNPRRLQLFLEKYREAATGGKPGESE